ncbi:hypothetical protein [uncultured Mediterranean phage uvDeep-CGR2-KM19-C37]|nr:hypothetical protein [uncultured Mediterranean phage uvDeep-CGR2-KM19-C37]
MSEKTIIAWTDHTFNIAWGCTKVSPGCKNCYAEGIADRYGWDAWGASGARRTFGKKRWQEPLKWNRAAEAAGVRKKVFASSMCDNFEDHPVVATELKKLWPLIERTPWLDWQLLTKRANRIAECLPKNWGDGWPNVWLGVSIENDEYAWRADRLREVPAAIRFVSYEPALGPLDSLNLDGISWAIYGGESGPRFRPHSLEWARSMRDRCKAAGTAFFYKQSPNRFTERGTQIDGYTIREFPATSVVIG